MSKPFPIAGKRYVLMPGIVSAFDGNRHGDRHYIGAPMLARLYRVDIDECIIWEPGDMIDAAMLELPILAPRDDGNYKLEEQ